MTKQAKSDVPKTAPPLTTNSQIRKIGALALDAAEKSIAEGTASSQIISLFLEYVLAEKELELETSKLRNQLLEAKIGSLQRESKIEELIQQGIDAFRAYTPPNLNEGSNA